MIKSPPPANESMALLHEFERTGCSRAFEAIVQHHRSEVLAICTRIMRNPHDAEDAAQAVFLTLALQARGGNSIQSLAPWLRQVARRVCLDMLKSRKRRQRHEDHARTQTPALSKNNLVQQQLDQQELQSILNQQIERLPAKYRTPMVLYYFGGLSLPQMAQQLNVTPKALGVRLLRARRMLAEQLSGASYPWFAVALAPALLIEAVRQGGSGSHSLAGAVTIPLSHSIGRRALVSIAVVAGMTTSVGTASSMIGHVSLKELVAPLKVERFFEHFRLTVPAPRVEAPPPSQEAAPALANVTPKSVEPKPNLPIAPLQLRPLPGKSNIVSLPMPQSFVWHPAYETSRQNVQSNIANSVPESSLKPDLHAAATKRGIGVDLPVSRRAKSSNDSEKSIAPDEDSPITAEVPPVLIEPKAAERGYAASLNSDGSNCLVTGAYGTDWLVSFHSSGGRGGRSVMLDSDYSVRPIRGVPIYSVPNYSVPVHGASASPPVIGVPEPALPFTLIVLAVPLLRRRSSR